jgi:hypothetical protein
VTPLGTFVTITAAAEAHGIDQTYGSHLAREQRNGWRYLVVTRALSSLTINESFTDGGHAAMRLCGREAMRLRGYEVMRSAWPDC